MKKVLSILILTTMILTLFISSSGCKNTSDNDSNDGGDYTDAVPGGSADVSTEVIEALSNSGEISMYMFGDGGDSSNVITDWYKGFFDYYKQVYNGTVDVRNIVKDNWEEKFLIEYASNDNPELLYLFEINFPQLPNRGLVYSVDDMKDMGVVGFDHPQLTKDLDLVSNYYTFNGKLYTFGTKMAEADMLFFNADMFKEYGVKNPMEYYQDGTWNWENFEKCAAAMTRDLDKDGNSDTYGYYGWDGFFIIAAAGGELVSLNEDGTLEVTLNTPATIQGLENRANLYGRLKAATPYSGKVAMWAHMPNNQYINWVQNNNMPTYEWGMVPYPQDSRTNSANIRSGKSYAWCVASTATKEQAQGCVNYVIAYNTYSEMNPNPDDLDYSKLYSEEQLEMIRDCTRQAIVPIHQGVGTIWDNQWEFWGMVERGAAATEVVAAYESFFKSQVAIENGNRAE